MKITTGELRALTERLIRQMEELGHNDIELTHEYYWDVPALERYDRYSVPEVDLGQLSEDWDQLSRILDRSAEPTPGAIGLLGNIYRAIGAAG